jgi:hypothetical protein
MSLNNIEVYKYGMFIIQKIQNEELKKSILILNNTFFDYLIEDIKTHNYYFLYNKSKDINIDLFTKFISFINEMILKKNKKNKKYNIKIKGINTYQPIFQIILMN